MCAHHQSKYISSHMYVVPELSSAVLRVLEALELDGQDWWQAPHVHLLGRIAELLTARAVALLRQGGTGDVSDDWRERAI